MIAAWPRIEEISYTTTSIIVWNALIYYAKYIPGIYHRLVRWYGEKIVSTFSTRVTNIIVSSHSYTGWTSRSRSKVQSPPTWPLKNISDCELKSTTSRIKNVSYLFPNFCYVFSIVCEKKSCSLQSFTMTHDTRVFFKFVKTLNRCFCYLLALCKKLLENHEQ